VIDRERHIHLGWRQCLLSQVLHHWHTLSFSKTQVAESAQHTAAVLHTSDAYTLHMPRSDFHPASCALHTQADDGSLKLIKMLEGQVTLLAAQKLQVGMCKERSHGY
jgi:hypothetical protein